MKKKSSPHLTIMMPVRNEGVNIPIMLKILNAVIDVQCEILIIYDNANDDTIPIVRKLRFTYRSVRLVHNKLGKGVVNALKTGIKEAKGKYILIFAVDEIGPVLAISDMIKLMEEGCDLVSCTRYAYGGRRLGGSLIQGLLSKLGNTLFRIISGTSLTDSTTGIKMFRKDIFNKINLQSEPIGWAVIFELAIKAQIAGLKLGEVPIISIDRLYGGKSTFNLKPWFKEYIRWFIWGIVRLHSFKKKTKHKIRIPASTAY